MGGRGTGSGFDSWKSTLQKMAKQGKMPGTIVGNRAQQAMVLEEIDKLYPMPQVPGARVSYSDDAVWVAYNSHTWRGSLPSGTAASDAEKSGALKKLLAYIVKQQG